jgi:ATPase subunit of ABC transporter with duplicated ATPase domains
LLQRQPAVELLVLDEPTHALDLIGQRALVEVLRAWPGGLVVTSHDAEFLLAIGVDDTIDLGTRTAPHSQKNAESAQLGGRCS